MRGVVLLFLFYTAAEIAYPQICGEQLGNVVFGGRSLSKPTAGEQTVPKVSASDFEERDQPQNQEPRDEDCFCCCSHIIAGVIFLPPGQPYLRLERPDNEQLATPNSDFENPNPPPRLA